jgi:hypothetical protein
MGGRRVIFVVSDSTPGIGNANAAGEFVTADLSAFHPPVRKDHLP